MFKDDIWTKLIFFLRPKQWGRMVSHKISKYMRSLGKKKKMFPKRSAGRKKALGECRFCPEKGICVRNAVLEAGKSKGRESLWAAGRCGQWNWFWTSKAQSYKRINVCSFKPLSVAVCYSCNRKLIHRPSIGQGVKSPRLDTADSYHLPAC